MLSRRPQQVCLDFRSHLRPLVLSVHPMPLTTRATTARRRQQPSPLSHSTTNSPHILTRTTPPMQHQPLARPTLPRLQSPADAAQPRRRLSHAEAGGSVAGLFLLCTVEASRTSPVFPQSPQGSATLAPKQASTTWFTDRPVMPRDKQMSPAVMRDLLHCVSKIRLLC